VEQAPSKTLQGRTRKAVVFTHIHKNAGSTMCKAAKEAGESVVKPGVNCNYRGDAFDD